MSKLSIKNSGLNIEEEESVRNLEHKNEGNILNGEEEEESESGSEYSTDSSGEEGGGGKEPHEKECEEGDESEESSSGESVSSAHSSLLQIHKIVADTTQPSSSNICDLLQSNGSPGGEMKIEMKKADIRRCRGVWEEDEESEEGGESETEDLNLVNGPDFETLKHYEDYLDHFVTSKDLYYLESTDVARTITTLGYRVPGLLSKEEFMAKVSEIEAKKHEKRRDDVWLSEGLDEEIACPLMRKLAAREVRSRRGKMACIIYIRTVNEKDYEVSGWIDYSVRLDKDGDETWLDYFKGTKKLMPKSNDLCYYNWKTHQVRYKSSKNYKITTEFSEGLQFENRIDAKLITVNPKNGPVGDSSTRVIKVKAPNYLDVILYDHYLPKPYCVASEQGKFYEEFDGEFEGEGEEEEIEGEIE